MSRTGPLGAATVEDVASICQFLRARNTLYPIARERGFDQQECNLVGLNDTLISLTLPMCWVTAQQAVATTRIGFPTAFAAAKQLLETMPNAEFHLSIGKWVVSRYDLLTFIKQMRSTYPDATEETVQVHALPLGSICEQLLMNRFTQICEDMVEAAKTSSSPEEIRTRTV